MNKIFSPYSLGKWFSLWRNDPAIKTSLHTRTKRNVIAFISVLVVPFLVYQLILAYFGLVNITTDFTGLLVLLGGLITLVALIVFVGSYLQATDEFARTHYHSKQWRQPWLIAASIVVVLFFSVIAVHIILAPYQSVPNNNQTTIQQTFGNSWTAALFTTIIGGITAPLLEEGIFRMTVIGQSEKHRLSRSLISVVLFVLAHVFSQLGLIVHPLTFLALTADYLILGTALATIYYRTNQIKYSFLVHVLWNSIALLQMALY